MGLITIINLAFIIFFATLDHKSFAASQEETAKVCNQDFRARFAHKLVAYLEKPTPSATKEMALKLCRISIEGPLPCPINITEDLAADFDASADTNPGIIPVLACAAKIAKGPVNEELNTLQAKLLDTYGETFFAAWQLIPREVKSLAQSFDDFARIPSDPEASSQKKIKNFETRVSILEKAPANLKSEVASSLAFIKGQILDSHLQEKTYPSDETTIAFKRSQFYPLLTDKLIRMIKTDPPRTTTIAIEAMETQGLDYKVYFKTGSRNWNLCSTATNSVDGCKLSDVHLTEGQDSCGKFGYLDVFLQAGPTWIAATDKTNFRINAPEYLTPVAVLLQKSESVVRFWTLPDRFEPKYLSPDLHMLLSRAVVKTDQGKKLAEIFITTKDSGKIQIVDPPKDKELKNFIPISDLPLQKIKDLDGSALQLVLPKICR